jgi:beta-lactam-binding protein with PASTA domain
MLNSSVRIVLWSLVIVFALTNSVTARQSQEQVRERSAEADRAAEAAGVLGEIMNIAESAVPEELMARAHGGNTTVEPFAAALQKISPPHVHIKN